MKDWKSLNRLIDLSPEFGRRVILRRKLTFWRVADLRRWVPQLSCRAFQVAAEMGLAELEVGGDQLVRRFVRRFAQKRVDPSKDISDRQPALRGSHLMEEYIRFTRDEVIFVLKHPPSRKETDEELEALGFEICDDRLVLRTSRADFGGPDHILGNIGNLIPRSYPKDILRSCEFTICQFELDNLPLDVGGNLLPCIFGPPTAPDLRPYLSWCNGLIPRLAETIYRENAWQEVCVLGDALEEAGCTNSDVLWACRTPPHVKGFWVVDLLRGLPHLRHQIKR